MIRVEKLRQIEPAFADLSDEQVEALCKDLYESAELAFELWWRKKYGSKCPVGSFPSGE
jgi:hypothetical protein